jgi:lactate dehydrogenase-like 2-hydroxyacid dehydrogenase
MTEVSMSRPALLLQSEYTDRLLDGALAGRFEVIRPWMATDPHAVIEGRGGDVIATLTTHVDAWLLDRLPNLRLIVAPGAGYENIDVAAARARGVKIANAGDTHSADVADHALALVLASVHRLPEAQDCIRSGRWMSGAQPPSRRAMSAQRFGIVGLGNIGTAIAERLAPFGGEIAWWSRTAKETPWPRKASLTELAQWCTALIVATRGDAAGLIDAEVISAVGSQGLIVNIARGAVVDQEALIAALKEGRLGCAALDVFTKEPTPPEPWRDTPNVILTPHIAGVSRESTMRLREAAIRNILTVLDGGPLVHEVSP